MSRRPLCYAAPMTSRVFLSRSERGGGSEGEREGETERERVRVWLFPISCADTQPPPHALHARTRTHRTRQCISCVKEVPKIDVIRQKLRFSFISQARHASAHQPGTDGHI